MRFSSIQNIKEHLEWKMKKNKHHCHCFSMPLYCYYVLKLPSDFQKLIKMPGGFF